MKTIKEARMSAKISQAKMSELFGIPERTIASWEGESGKREAPEYVQKMIINQLCKLAAGEIVITKDEYGNDCLAEKMWCLEEYRDKAGIGSATFFYSKEDAMKFAEEEWNRLCENDKNSYRNDAAGMFSVFQKWARNDDGEWVPAGDGYNGLDDPIKEAKNFLEK